MKKFIFLLATLLTISLFAVAQIKFVIFLNDDEPMELLAESVDSILFTGVPVEPEKPDTPVIPDEPDIPEQTPGDAESANGYEYVDLGLSVKWAKCNVGADNSYEYGNYYAWGEVNPKRSYAWSTYAWGTSEENIYKYYGYDRNQLEPNDDVVTTNMGGTWRMPTEYEFQELIENCTWVYYSQNGFDGYKITSRINNNSIFLPYSGYKKYATLEYEGSYGLYWTNSLVNDNYNSEPSALFITPDEKTIGDTERYDRYLGGSVRGVLSKYLVLSFDANGGQGSIPSITTNMGRVSLPSAYNLSKEGYTFKCWNTRADGTGERFENYDLINLYSDLTLYAQWEDNQAVEDEPEEEWNEDIPYVETPDYDQTTFLFHIENAECDDFVLYLMGIDGVWEDTPEMEFERVEGTTSWFKVTVPAMDEFQSNFKIRANGDWAFEPKAGYEFLGDAADYVADGADGGNQNNLMMLQYAGGKVLAFHVVEFVTPCAEEATYTITLKTNYCGVDGTDVGIIGNFTGWSEVILMEKLDDTTYQYVIEDGFPGMEFRFQSNDGGWYNEPVEWNFDEYGEYYRLSNFQLGYETNIYFDLTEPNYTWTYCIE